MDMREVNDFVEMQGKGICIHLMPAEWCATCREIKQKKHEQEVNVGIFENFKEWTK